MAWFKKTVKLKGFLKCKTPHNFQLASVWQPNPQEKLNIWLLWNTLLKFSGEECIRHKARHELKQGIKQAYLLLKPPEKSTWDFCLISALSTEILAGKGWHLACSIQSSREVKATQPAEQMRCMDKRGRKGAFNQSVNTADSQELCTLKCTWEMSWDHLEEKRGEELRWGPLGTFGISRGSSQH